MKASNWKPVVKRLVTLAIIIVAAWLLGQAIVIPIAKTFFL